VTLPRRLRLTPLGLVGLAALLFAVLALLFVGLDRQVRWDEVTYLAQVTPGQPDVWFGPQRARGMTLVVLPVALFGAPLTALRLYMIVVSAVALFLAFRPWARLAGWTGGTAALVAACAWVPLYFAVELYPNLLAGFGAVAAAGHLARWVRERRGGDLVGLAVAVAVVAWLRPTESVWLCLGLAPLAVVLARGQAWRAWAAMLVGGFFGWLPWALEAVARFGGPLARLRGATGESASGQSRNSLIQYLNLVEGPVRRVVADPVLTYRALGFLVVLAALAVLGIAQRRDDVRRTAAVVGLVTAAAAALPYLVLNAGINLRYVLPALLLATVPIGAGIVTLAVAVRRARAVVTGVALAAVALVAVGWQGTLAARNSADIAPLQAVPVALGEALRDAAGGEPCAFLAERQWPELQWHSGCLGEVLHLEAPLLQCHSARRDLAALADDGYRVFVLARGAPPAAAPLADWPVRELPVVEDGAWRLYERPAGADASAAPTIPLPADSPTPCPPSQAPDTVGARLELRWTRDEG